MAEVIAEVIMGGEEATTIAEAMTQTATAGEIAVKHGFVSFDAEGNIVEVPPSEVVGDAYLNLIARGYI